MPGLSRAAAPEGLWPMELEAQQHYFYYDGLDMGEDFYKSTAPSEDIWKKFELLPTPPVSPSRFGSECPAWLAQEPAFEEGYVSPYDLELEPLDVLANLSSIVLKDCMWSGLAASQQLEKVARDAKAVPTARTQRVVPAVTHAYGSPATQCVSPAAVLSLPGHHGKKTASGSSGSDSHSDSSDDDDEIDVVTVDNRPKRGRPPGRRTPVTIAVSADPHGPCPKHFHISLHRQQHNYAAPSPDSDHEEEDLEPQEKRARLECSSSSSSSPLSSPASSDSEDATEQRRNFLERKRRDDLRSRFQALRGEIPGLSESAKTSKVAILTRATEYLVQLRACERRQSQERKKLRAKQQQLLRKISALKNS
ncbi:protein L-Myc-1a isoform X2 [Salminus brasiliensis]